MSRMNQKVALEARRKLRAVLDEDGGWMRTVEIARAAHRSRPAVLAMLYAMRAERLVESGLSPRHRRGRGEVTWRTSGRKLPAWWGQELAVSFGLHRYDHRALARALGMPTTPPRAPGAISERHLLGT